jgi:thioredoxin-like negative regulator of GroEL
MTTTSFAPNRTLALGWSDSATFDRIALDTAADCVVVFGGALCNSARRLLRRLASSAPPHEIAVLAIDADASPGLARRHQVTAIPMVLYFRQGQVAARRIGELGDSDIVDWLAALLPPHPAPSRRRA